MSAEGNELADRLQSEIATAVHERDGAMLIKYTAVVEVLDSDGDRALWMLATNGSNPWEITGLLEYARDLQRANAVAGELEEG